MTEVKRASDPVLAELLARVIEINGTLKSHMNDHDSNHMAIETQLSGMRESVAIICSGFPDNDPTGHRNFHESYIKKMAERAEFWKKMSFELGKYGLLGFIGWALYALWIAFLHGPGK